MFLQIVRQSNGWATKDHAIEGKIEMEKDVNQAGFKEFFGAAEDLDEDGPGEKTKKNPSSLSGGDQSSDQPAGRQSRGQLESERSEPRPPPCH